MNCSAVKTYLQGLAAAPAGVELLQDSDLPPDVCAVLESANVGFGSFLQLIPLLLQLFQNEQLRDFLRQLFDILKPAPGTVEAFVQSLIAE